MSSLTSFRQAVQDHLQTDLGVPMVAGTREGRSDDRDIGYVWVEDVAEVSGNVNDETVIVGVRVFKQWKQQQGTHRDVTAMEDMIEAIQTSLKPVRTTLGPWFFRVTHLVPDYADQHVTATIEGYQQNLGEA